MPRMCGSMAHVTPELSYSDKKLTVPTCAMPVMV
jgi:hypothetical protein